MRKNIPQKLTEQKYAVYGNKLLPAILTPNELTIMKLIDQCGHIWHYSMTGKGDDGINMTLRQRRIIANGLVKSGYLWRQDPIEFDITRAGEVALEYLKIDSQNKEGE